MAMNGVTVIIRGPHDSGRSTLAHIIKEYLRENEYADVTVEDDKPLPDNQKDVWWARFQRNRGRPVRIKVELEG